MPATHEAKPSFNLWTQPWITLERPDGTSGLLAFVLEIGVVLLLALDTASRQPEREPEHPYAL